MKNYSNFIAISLLGMATLFTSCEKEGIDESSESTITGETNIVSQEVLEKIESLALNTKDVTLEDFVLPDGSTEKRYMVEGDIAISPSYIENMELNGGVQSEQYRTNNLVSPGVITVLGFDGGRFALSTRNRNGLQLAVDNFNRLNLDISMDLSLSLIHI